MKECLPLDDITVLDLSWVIAGPHSTRMLADLGAKVIKVTSVSNVDVVRTDAMRNGNYDCVKEGGWLYQELNHGKLDIAINLKSAQGREIFNELVSISDIVVCNYGVNAFNKLGLRFEDLSKIKPDIIVINASGLGDWGPYSSFVTYAPVLQSITGIESLVGYEGDNAPVDEYAAVADYIGSLTIANYLLAALEHHHRTGEGQFIDISQGEAAAVFLGTALLEWQANGVCRGLIGNRHHAEQAAPHNVYPCKNEDTWCAVAVITQEEWNRFCSVIDPCAAWSEDKRFATLESRIENQDDLDLRITEWTKRHDPVEAACLLQQVGVSAAPVQTALDCIYNDEHLKERSFFREVVFEEPDRTPERFLVTGVLPYIEGLNYPHAAAPASATGGDTRDVLRDILHKGEDEICTLIKSGAAYAAD